jgi:hypothetical protein
MATNQNSDFRPSDLYAEIDLQAIKQLIAQIVSSNNELNLVQKSQLQHNAEILAQDLPDKFKLESSKYIANELIKQASAINFNLPEDFHDRFADYQKIIQPLAEPQKYEQMQQLQKAGFLMSLVAFDNAQAKIDLDYHQFTKKLLGDFRPTNFTNANSHILRQAMAQGFLAKADFRKIKQGFGALNFFRSGKSPSENVDLRAVQENQLENIDLNNPQVKVDPGQSAEKEKRAQSKAETEQSKKQGAIQKQIEAAKAAAAEEEKQKQNQKRSAASQQKAQSSEKKLVKWTLITTGSLAGGGAVLAFLLEKSDNSAGSNVPPRVPEAMGFNFDFESLDFLANGVELLIGLIS